MARFLPYWHGTIVPDLRAGRRVVIAAHGNPIPFLRKGSRDELRAATGTTKLPTLKLSDGTVISNSPNILAWIAEQQPAARDKYTVTSGP